MDNSNNQELTFKEAIDAMSSKNDDGNIDPQEIKPPKIVTVDMTL